MENVTSSSLVTIIVNTFGNDIRQNVAVESWHNLQEVFPGKVEIIDLQFVDEQDTFQSPYTIPVRHVLEKSSLTLEPRSIKKLPLIFEMIEKGFAESTTPYILYTNSDVMLLPKVIDYIDKKRPDCMAGSRMDIAPIESFREVMEDKAIIARYEIAGFDFFVFEREWFSNHRKYFDYDFVVGRQFFDIDYAGMMVLFGKKYHIANDAIPMAVHIHHGSASVTTECPENEHNWQVHHSDPLLQVAYNVMFFNLQHNLCKRTPWGVFIKPTPEETLYQDIFFNTMNVHHPNQLRMPS